MWDNEPGEGFSPREKRQWQVAEMWELAQDFEAAIDPDERQLAAFDMVTGVLARAADFCGTEAMNLVYGSVRDGSPRRESLGAVAWRLRVARGFFAAFERTAHPSSLALAEEEILAISGGDAPRLFSSSGRQGKRTNAFRLAITQLKALGWAAYMTEAGLVPFKRQKLITDAFGKPWDTIRKWSQPVADLLGKEYVEGSLLLWRTDARGQPISELSPEQSQFLTRDGASYQEELSRQGASLA